MSLTLSGRSPLDLAQSKLGPEAGIEDLFKLTVLSSADVYNYISNHLRGSELDIDLIFGNPHLNLREGVEGTLVFTKPAFWVIGQAITKRFASAVIPLMDDKRRRQPCEGGARELEKQVLLHPPRGTRYQD